MQDARDLRSYGRRRGRARSRRQQDLWLRVLPQVAFAPETLSQHAASETWLEIGFGGGEHLVWQATHHPHTRFVGCEPFEDGVVKVLDAIESRDITNIRLWPDDARPLLRALPAASIGRVFILFPDPWPKARHQKRRLVSPETIEELARVMRPRAELRIGTDIGSYAAAILQAVQGHRAFIWACESPSDWRLRPEDWPGTRYEAKALAAGRRCYYFRFRRSG
jgi:tRNA (guanine-N7-)-methyltransferase